MATKIDNRLLPASTREKPVFAARSGNSQLAVTNQRVAVAVPRNEPGPLLFAGAFLFGLGLAAHIARQ